MKLRSASTSCTGGRVQAVWTAASFGALAFGALIYALMRSHAAAFLPSGWHHPVLASTKLPLASALIGGAPTFLHALAMSLLVVVATQAATPRGRGACCAAVCAVEFAFEFAQHTVVAALLLGSVTVLPMVGGIGGLWRSYVTHGTFDPLDLVAACAGCLAAFAVCARAVRDRPITLGAHHATD